MDSKAIHRANIYSDHQLLSGVIRLRPAAIHQQRKSKRRYNIQRLQDNDIADQFAIRLNHKLANRNYSDDRWSNVAEACKQSAEEILGYTHHHGKPWIREATWKQIDDRRRLKTELAQTRTLADKHCLREEYDHAERQVKTSKNVSTLVTALTPVMRDAWLNCKIPGSWKDGNIFTILKKGDLSDCKNWRGITLLIQSKKYWL